MIKYLLEIASELCHCVGTVLTHAYSVTVSLTGEYEFIIRTNVEPWSKHIEKEAEKKAKRDAKGKKKSTVDEMM